VHGGGFYVVRKFRVTPETLPATLHWLKWEAYWTWISGFALLVLMYYLHARVYLGWRQTGNPLGVLLRVAAPKIGL
jgi:uncharacterized membrane protein